MDWNKHWELEGKHAFLSPSQYHWINYDEETLKTRYLNYQAKERGTKLHELAASCIEHRVKLARSKMSLSKFVNDAIGFRMTPEQTLYYSPNCFGTADAISFRKEKGRSSNMLRIHDLKTGTTSASMLQLMVYAALFCLEYGYSPEDIDIELRIYQLSDPEILVPEPSDIFSIMDTIVKHDSLLAELQSR